MIEHERSTGAYRCQFLDDALEVGVPPTVFLW